MTLRGRLAFAAAAVLLPVAVVAADLTGAPPPAGGETALSGLRLVREVDVTPGGGPLVRPELVQSGGTLFVGYTALTAPRSRRLLQLDAALRPVQVFALATDGGEPTDMRWIGAADGTLWCAYETAETGSAGGGPPPNGAPFPPAGGAPPPGGQSPGPGSPYPPPGELSAPAGGAAFPPGGGSPPPGGGPRPAPTTLSLASYRFASGTVAPLALARNIARGAVLAPPWSIPKPGAEITDDPTPFLLGGAVVLGTRQFERAVLPLRSFRPDGAQAAAVELDLSGVFPNRSLSVYSLVTIEGRPWLLVGAETPPRSPNPAGDIYAVPLQADLGRPDGAAVPLVATPAFETYVSGARIVSGVLAMVHVVNNLSAPGCFEGHLRVFDPAKGFAQIGHALVNVTSGGMQLDNHLSVEVVDGRIFVAYATPQCRLMVREYALEGR